MEATLIKSDTQILKRNGSWIYCEECNNRVAYLYYRKYDYFKYNYKCNCGNHGSVEIGTKPQVDNLENDFQLTHKGKRMRCSKDGAPLFSIMDKNIERFEYEVICKKCGTFYSEQI